jgi:DNA polymerase-1
MSVETYELVRTAGDVERISRELVVHPHIGVDTETTALDPYEGRIRLLQVATPTKVYVLDLFDIPAEALASLREVLQGDRPVKVLHNAKFDAKMLLHHYGIELGRLFDTMLASQLIAAGDTTQKHSLAEVVRRYLGQTVDKTQRLSDWSQAALTPAQLTYAAQDVSVLLALRRVMVEKLKELRLVEAARLEFEAVIPTAAMELAGMPLDRAAWQALVAELESRRAALEDRLQKLVAEQSPATDLFGYTDINFNSPQQVLELLQRLGLPLRGTTEVELLPFKSHPIVSTLLEYRSVQKLLSTYGRSVLDHLHPVTGRLHGDFHQIGTPTGRYSCSDPNLQQVPNLPDVRRSFAAPPGRTLIVADYSQIELRILADFSQDPRLLEAFLNDIDLHCLTASLMFKVPLEAVTKQQRAIAKTINYGLAYGMGAAGLAARIETSVAEAEQLMATYFDIYRHVAEWLRAAGDTAVAVGHSRSQSGRLWNFRFDPSDREQVATIQRLGKNAPIQGTSADILKRAMRLVYDGLKPYDAQIVNSIHDEIVVEAAESHAEEVAAVVRQQMIQAGQEFIKTVPVEVDVTISPAWLK